MSRSGDPFDTYLLRVLCTLVTERSVSRTAVKLNQTQPAISAALKRLRDAFNDPLLVREKSGMVPTERALELLAPARIALEEIDKLFVAGEKFDPAATQHTFKLGPPDYVVVTFLTSAVEALRKSAPQAKLAIHALGPDYDYERALGEGKLDVVIGNWPEPPPNLHLSTTHHFARHYAKFLPLAIADSPIPFPRMRFYQLWHDRTHHSARHRWLRSLLSATADRLWRSAKATA